MSLAMRDIILRFPHLAEQIFQQLNNEDLVRCREVEKLWKEFIDERNYPWLRIVNIPTVLQNGNTYMHLAAQCGQTNMFEKLLSKEDNKNVKNNYGESSFLHFPSLYCMIVTNFLIVHFSFFILLAS